MPKPQLYAELPQELQEADEILRRYARWAWGGSGAQTCGSAEGRYRAPQDDEDRQPSAVTMPPRDVDRARAALTSLPMMTRLVIQWLYVHPGQIQTNMRRHGIQPRHMRERHLEGVTMFWRHWERSGVCGANTTIALGETAHV